MSAGPTVVVRRIAAVPVRRAGEAWRVIAELLAEPGSPAYAELLSIASPVGLLLAQEITRTRPIVVTAGTGPRIRIYTSHGSAAQDEASETPLASRPCSSDSWQIRLPCNDEDLQDLTELLVGAPHVLAGDVADEELAIATSISGAGDSDFTIDRSQME